MTAHCRHWFLSAFFLAALSTPPYARADAQHELLLFLSAGPTNNAVNSEEGPEGSDMVIDADILYSYLNGRFRLLGEYLISTEESELERFQLGWQFSSQNIGWAGRFHSPGRYWNQIYHHGQYLQTSITRPITDQFEDDAGFLPTHISGLMLESSVGLDQTDGFQFALSIGAAPVIGDNELAPFDLLDKESSHGAAADLRLAYLPDPLSDNQIGVTLGRYDLEIDGNAAAVQQGLDRVEQYTIGAYIDWHWERLRLLSSIIRVSNRMSRTTLSDTDAFVIGYFQAEYAPSHRWTLFGRIEGTTDPKSSSYIALFPNSITDRQIIGIRYDYARHNALTVETSNAETISEEFSQLMFQWSTVFP